MRYADTLLSGGEIVVRRARQHWLALVVEGRLGLVLMVLGVVLLALIAVGPFQARQARDVLSLVALAVLVVGLVFFLFHAWGWWAQDYLITNRRILKVEGIINKRSADSSLEKINDARLEQSIFGRVFGFGTLDILTAAEEMGGSTLADFPMIADPIDFKRAMLDQKQMLERPDLAPPRYQHAAQQPEMQRAEPMPPRAGSDRVALSPEAAPDAAPPPEPTPTPPETAAAPNPADELATTLERLAGLRDRGLITPEEYEAKKRDLLERM